MSDGTVFGLIRDIKDRREDAKIRDITRNYLDKPEEAFRAVAEISLPKALKLRDIYQTNRANEQTLTKGDTALAVSEADRYTTALRGVTQTLKKARNTPGVDVGAVYDEMTPVFANGFRMSPEEIAEWREKITLDPSIIDNLDTAFASKEQMDPKVLAPGAALVGGDGKPLFQNPAAPKTIKMKNDKGGEDLYVMDQQGNFILSESVVSGAPGGEASVPGTPFAGPQGINPQARGVRNNNLGNIKDGPWARRQPGYAGSDGTFARFQDASSGNAAQERLLGQNYVNGKRSVSEIVLKYLGGPQNPENSDASQKNYISYVAGRIGLDPNAPVQPDKLPIMAQAMREFENGNGQRAAPQPAVSTSGPPEGWRNLTNEEKSERGLDPKGVYQIGLSGANTGKVAKIEGEAKTKVAGKAGKPAGVTLRAHTTAVGKLGDLVDKADRLLNHDSFNQATGSIAGAVPSILPGSVEFDKDLSSYRDAVVIGALLAMKEASPNGASGFGSLQLKEGERLENQGGALNPRAPTDLRRTLTTQKKDAQVSIGLLYNIPPSATLLLIQRPNLRSEFEKKYGAAATRAILRK